MKWEKDEMENEREGVFSLEDMGLVRGKKAGR